MQNLRPLVALIMVMAGTITYAQVTAVSSLGARISRETGEQWISNYKQQFKTTSEHICGRETMMEMFRSADAAGVYLIKALDNDGNERLVIKAAGEDGALLRDSKAVLTEIDRTANGESAGYRLDDLMARPMIEKFQQVQKKNEFGAHVYGKKVFEDLLSQPGATGVYIAKGLDERGQEHLVLAALDKQGEVMWTANIWNHGSGIFSIFYPIIIAVAAR
jgi:hypothetical protein